MKNILLVLLLKQYLIYSYGQTENVGQVMPINNAYDCLNPNRIQGLCISLHYCPTLVNISQQDTGNQRFLNQSNCRNGFGPYPYVCCTNEYSFITSSERSKIGRSFTQTQLLATPEECTVFNSIYEYRGGSADINDYHWMAIIGNILSNGTIIPTYAGSLISHRYILAAADCNRWVTENPNAKVRLGEYDLDQVIDCVHEKCVGPAIDVNIDKIIVHENYDRRFRHDNIALIRLSQEVPYNDNIAPICLSSTVGFNGSNTGEGLFIAGWGRTTDGEFSRIKLTANLPIFDHSECDELYRNKTNETINDKQICAGGQGESVCGGDSGVPLMRRYYNSWIVEGIASFVFSCGLKGFPDVFTRVSKYEEWIIKNIQP